MKTCPLLVAVSLLFLGTTALADTTPSCQQCKDDLKTAAANCQKGVQGPALRACTKGAFYTRETECHKVCGDKTTKEVCKECMTEVRAGMKACGTDEACQKAWAERGNACNEICQKAIMGK